MVKGKLAGPVNDLVNSCIVPEASPPYISALGSVTAKVKVLPLIVISAVVETQDSDPINPVIESGILVSPSGLKDAPWRSRTKVKTVIHVRVPILHPWEIPIAKKGTPGDPELITKKRRDPRLPLSLDDGFVGVLGHGLAANEQ
jgi:hypothetical protein